MGLTRIFSQKHPECVQDVDPFLHDLYNSHAHITLKLWSCFFLPRTWYHRHCGFTRSGECGLRMLGTFFHKPWDVHSYLLQLLLNCMNYIELAWAFFPPTFEQHLVWEYVMLTNIDHLYQPILLMNEVWKCRGIRWRSWCHERFGPVADCRRLLLIDYVHGVRPGDRGPRRPMAIAQFNDWPCNERSWTLWNITWSSTRFIQ